MPIGALPRVVRPEILDELPPEDPRAIKSRQDLARVNWWMGHANLLSNRIKESEMPIRVLELGAGDGRFLLSLLKRLGPAARGGHATLLDKAPVLSKEIMASYEQIGWTVRTLQADVRTWLSLERWDLIICNLFLHHFLDADLRQILQLALLRADWLLACEPRRSHRAWKGAQLLWLLGCNEVTRHDAVVSVQAGFRRNEISALLSDPQFKIREESVGLFSHLFEARRVTL
jgi:hypothetical protein